jgi:galactoside O-acetyltransferase
VSKGNLDFVIRIDDTSESDNAIGRKGRSSRMPGRLKALEHHDENSVPVSSDFMIDLRADNGVLKKDMGDVMAYLDRQILKEMGFAHLGKEVLVSDRAAIHEPEKIFLGDHARIDDFCVISGRVSLGRNTHVSVFCNLAGGAPGVFLSDFVTLAYGCHLFAQSDDYSGRTMTNPTVPDAYKAEIHAAVYVGRHAIIGTQGIVFPGADIAEGCAIGAGAVVTKPTEPWGIYVGNPARRVKERARDLLALEARYLAR